VRPCFQDTGIVIKIKPVSGAPDFTLPPLLPESSIGAVKGAIESHAKTPVSLQRLIYKGKVLKDDETLELHQVKTGETIILQVIKVPAATPAAASAATASLVATATSSTSNANTSPLDAALDTLVGSNTKEGARLALETLVKIVDNITSHPEDAKYRKLKHGKTRSYSKT
jgi:hypothetical protein